MAVRENERESVLNQLVSKLCAAIRCMEDGSQESIGHLVSRYYKGKGYELHWLDGKHDNGWTKDDRKTFSVCQEDLLDREPQQRKEHQQNAQDDIGERDRISDAEQRAVDHIGNAGE